MGRPRKTPENARNARINIRVRAVYADWLRRLAVHSGAADVTDFVVDMAAEQARKLKFESPPER